MKGKCTWVTFVLLMGIPTSLVGSPPFSWDAHVSVGSPHGNPSLFVDKSNGNPHLLHGTPSSLWSSPRGSPPPSWDTQFLVDKSKRGSHPYWDTHVSVGSPHGNPIHCGHVQWESPPPSWDTQFLVDKSNRDPHLTLGHPTSSMGIPISFIGHPAKERLIYVIKLTRSNKNKIRKIQNN